MSEPSLETPRLLLRAFADSDAGAVQELAGKREIADTTQSIPHPYEDGVAEHWIKSLKVGQEAGAMSTWAITGQHDGVLLGAVGLTIERELNKAELGYWIGVPYWNRGYATEAAEAVLRYGFAVLQLNRISARHLVRNPASGRVIQKIGMHREGVARQDTMKWGRYEDVIWYSMLRDELPVH